MVTKKYKDHIERSKGYIRVRFKGKITTLHRAIWELAHGPIPEGYFIHHIDKDKTNNSIENLECVSRKEHGVKHRKK